MLCLSEGISHTEQIFAEKYMIPQNEHIPYTMKETIHKCINCNDIDKNDIDKLIANKIVRTIWYKLIRIDKDRYSSVTHQTS